jgi:hypothetical protein
MDKIYYKKVDYDNFVNYIVFYAVMSVLDATKSNNVSVGKTSLYFISGISKVSLFHKSMQLLLFTNLHLQQKSDKYS